MSQEPIRHPLTDILFEALELDGDDRRRHLDRVCGEDAELREELESLLDTDDAAGFSQFLEQPALDSEGPLAPLSSAEEWAEPDLETIPEQIGPFRIVRQLGFGGMGSVYLARQEEPIVRQVAIKVIHALHQERWRERFTAECQALARLNHPHIAALYEVGTTKVEGGRPLPFVAMEFVDGAPIDTWCDEEKAGIERRLRLFLDVCAGVTHAHRNGILHCDLKPGNVLVSRTDGRPKVIDFGIARAVDDPERGTRLLSQEVQFGSPPYISPELVDRGGGQRLDTRTDVYALGLILYRLLVGVLPFRESSTWLLLLQLTEKEPALPSARFGELAAGERADIAADRHLEPAALIRGCRGNLDAIVGKAIDRDPDRRYGSPAEMAADIERHLSDEPILARAPTAGYLLGRFVRRHAQLVVAAGLLLVVLTGGLVARSFEAARANAEARRANVEAERANVEAARARSALAESEEIHQFLLGLFHAANPESDSGAKATIREVLEQGRESLQTDLADQPRLRASLLQSVGSVYTVLGEFETAAELVDEALSIRLEHLDAADPAIVESQSELGVILRRMGRYEDAEPLLRDVLEARKSDPAVDPELLAQAHNHLGLVYWRLYRYDEAEEALSASLELRRQSGQAASVAEAANNLGVLLQSQDRLSEARVHLVQALELFEESLGPDHPRIASALNNVGIVEEYLPTWRGAEALFRRAIAVSEASFGEVHFKTLNPRRNLVNQLRRIHRFDEALEEARGIVRMAEQLGDSMALTRALQTLGRTELVSRREAEAASTYGRCVDVSAAHLGPNHSQTQRCFVMQAQAIAFAGDIEGGLRRLEELGAGLEESLPETHQTRLTLDLVLGLVLHRGGKFEAAAERFTSYVERLSKRSHPHGRLISMGWHLHGEALAAAGRVDAGAELLQQALDRRSGSLGLEHPRVAESAYALGKLEMERRRLERARELLELSVSIRSALFEPDDPDRIASEEALADCLARISAG